MSTPQIGEQEGLTVSQLHLSPERALLGWHAHSQGASALLEFRGSHILETSLGGSIFKTIFTQEVGQIISTHLFSAMCTNV